MCWYKLSLHVYHGCVYIYVYNYIYTYVLSCLCLVPILWMCCSSFVKSWRAHSPKCRNMSRNVAGSSWFLHQLVSIWAFQDFDLFEQAGLCRCLVWKNIGKGWTMPCSTVRKFSTWGSNKGQGKVYTLLLLLAGRAICYWKMLEGVRKWSQS